MGWVVAATLRVLYQNGKRPNVYCTGGWVCLRAVLKGYGKSYSNKGLNPEPSSLLLITIFNSIRNRARIVSHALGSSLSAFNYKIKYLTGMYKRDTFTFSVQRVFS
jgi:hypothetical protein